LNVSKPLHQLTKKAEDWQWDEEEQGSFEELKHLITSTLIIVQLNQDAPFRLETDASGYTTGAVLSQLCDDGKWHLVGITTKGLDSAERNYKVHNKKILSVIQGLKEWRHILEGTKHMIEILNDLTDFTMSQNLNH